MQGRLLIKPVRAQLERNSRLLVRNDPFIRIFLGKDQQITSIDKDGGKKPSWDDVLSFVDPTGPVCIIELWNKGNLLSDKLIGECKIYMDVIMEKKEFTERLTLMKRDKVIGSIDLEIKWQSGPVVSSPTNPGLSQSFARNSVQYRNSIAKSCSLTNFNSQPQVGLPPKYRVVYPM